MNKMQEQVAEFHKAFGVPVNQTPTIPSFDRLTLRCKLILEEAIKFCNACGVDVRILDNHDVSQRSNLCMETIEFRKFAITKPDLKEIADASTDLKYVTFGADIEFGLNAEPLFDEVHRSNMSKMWSGQEMIDALKEADYLKFTATKLLPENASLDEKIYSAKRADGKVIKSPSYSPANIQSVLEQLKGQSND